MYLEKETWFPTLIKSTMKAALDKMLLWVAMKVFRDELNALTARTTSTANQHVSDATPTPRKKKKRKKETVKLLEIVEEAVLESELLVESLSDEVKSGTFPVKEPLVEENPYPNQRLK
jgi:hypothetical protein